jgi:hypothetical protein
MMQSETLIFDNSFDAPPRFVKAWLTDFREDDGRFFGDPHAFRVRREGHVIHREQDNPLGRLAMKVDVAADDRWTVAGEQRKTDGSLAFAFHIEETVAPQGSGTRHMVRLVIEPAPALLPMLPDLVAGWRSMLTAGFERMKGEIALAARAGMAPTA